MEEREERIFEFVLNTPTHFDAHRPSSPVLTQFMGSYGKPTTPSCPRLTPLRRRRRNFPKSPSIQKETLKSNPSPSTWTRNPADAAPVPPPPSLQPNIPSIPKFHHSPIIKQSLPDSLEARRDPQVPGWRQDVPFNNCRRTPPGCIHRPGGESRKKGSKERKSHGFIRVAQNDGSPARLVLPLFRNGSCIPVTGVGPGREIHSGTSPRGASPGGIDAFSRSSDTDREDDRCLSHEPRRDG